MAIGPNESFEQAIVFLPHKSRLVHSKKSSNLKKELKVPASLFFRIKIFTMNMCYIYFRLAHARGNTQSKSKILLKLMASRAFTSTYVKIVKRVTVVAKD